MRRTVTLEQLQAFIQKYPPSAEASKRAGVTGTPDQDAYTTLRTAYLKNLDPADMLGLDLTISTGRHPTMLSLAGLLHDGHRDEVQLTELISDLWDAYCDRPPRGGEIDEIVQHTLRKKPVEFTLEEGHPALKSWAIGLKIFGTEEEYNAALKEKLFAEHQAARTETIPEAPETAADPEYPLDIWKGTDYYEFAEICSRDNYIPKHFLLEAIKTVTGAVLGRQLTGNMRGCLPRFYTILMGGAGSGKGTSIDYATSVFKDVQVEALKTTNLIFEPNVKIEDVKYKNIGVYKEAFNSAPGMQRSNEKGHDRWLQEYEELNVIMEGSSIEGSGQSLMAVNRQLYDREDFVTTGTAKRDAIAGKAQNSLLGGTTFDLWEDMFAGKSTKGSGLFQRFNLQVSTEHRRKGSLREPMLEGFKRQLVGRILPLDRQGLKLEVDDRAAAAMDEWFSQEKFADPELNAEVLGRLNILAWRNALHLAWQRDAASISLDHTLDAIKLSEFQFEIRNRYTPVEGENQGALVENKIRKALQVIKKATRRDLTRRLSLNRFGTSHVNRAFEALVANGEAGVLESNRGGKPVQFLVWNEGWQG